MVITAKDLIEKDIPVISFEHTVRDALQLLEDADLHQIVLVDQEHALGILYEEDLKKRTNHSQKLHRDMIRDNTVGINGRLHVLDAVKLIASNEWEVLPVLDDEMKYIGCFKWDYVLSVVSKMMAITLPGTILVLRRLPVDYSMAEIVRICESNECRVISSGIMQEDGTNALLITLKIDRNELGGLISSFERYEYEVVASFGDMDYKDFLKERYDLLMNYLNM